MFLLDKQKRVWEHLENVLLGTDVAEFRSSHWRNADLSLKSKSYIRVLEDGSILKH